MKNILLATVLALYSGLAVFAQQESVSNRAADVRVTFSDSKFYVGTYTGKQVARVCGQTDPMYFGKKTFDLEYPLDAPPDEAIEDVTFASEELVDGKKATTAFFVSVVVQSPAIGHPPKWVVDTTNAQDKASGSATLSGTGAELILTVKATNSLGEKLDLVVNCHPPKK